MARRGLFFQIFPAFIAVIFLTMLAIALLTRNIVREFHLESLAEKLQICAKTLEPDISELILRDNPDDLSKLANRFTAQSSIRVTIIKADGKVVCDTLENPSMMKNHSDRHEFIEAMKSYTEKSLKYSTALSENMLYVSIPVLINGKKEYVLRLAISTKIIEKTLANFYWKLASYGILVAFIGTIISALLSRKIAMPLLKLRSGAQAFARGDFSKKLEVPEIDEIRELASAMNLMAKEINRRINEITEQRNISEAILSSMQEGVLAVDIEQNTLIMNNSAIKLLNVEGQFIGKKFYEITRISSLQNFVDKVIAEKKPIEDEVNFLIGQKKIIYARGTVLSDASGNIIGALIVLSDITRIKKLEGMRSEFVANVSHEIKTPLTSIKASVETLLENNIGKKKEIEHLLKIISKNTDRLANLVEDILSLSALEQGKNTSFKIANIREIIDDAVEICRASASLKAISIKVECKKDISANIDKPLIEQALVNLIDNAIKYSEEKNDIEINTRHDAENIYISVKDYGCGIPQEHLPRIFERFYRIDKSRSRKIGGTGLGLAIVKHVMELHGGKVEVESKVGKGSLFRLIIPSVIVSY